MKNPRNILITGASSGIGEALAILYAKKGVSLHLSGRNEERLNAVAKTCREKGALVDAQLISVVDWEAMARWISDAARERPLDLVVANAGVGISSSKGKGIADIADKTFAVNVHGVFHTVHPALDVMKPQKRGQIAIISSLSAFVGMPGAPAYAASKAAALSYAEALRGVYRRDGIEVNAVCPGFITTRMTANNRFPMPFLIDSDKAASIIAKGLASNKGRIAFPFPMLAAIRILQFLPAAFTGFLLRLGPRK